MRLTFGEILWLFIRIALIAITFTAFISSGFIGMAIFGAIGCWLAWDVYEDAKYIWRNLKK